MLYKAQLHSTLHTLSPEGDSDTIEQNAPATVALREDGSWSVRFAEEENRGHTTIQGTNHWVSITREGDTFSHLLFRVGQRLESIYKTPHGEFEMATEATEFRVEVDTKEGNISLHYHLYISNSLATQNRLDVSWKKSEVRK